MNEALIKEILTSDETDRIERTVSTTDTDKFREAICSFSNDMPEHRKPGYLLIGVNDDGSPANLKIDDELQKKFASLRDDGQILPQPMMSVFKAPHPKGGSSSSSRYNRATSHLSDIAVEHISESVLEKRVANETEERRLIERRSANFRSFDIMPCMVSTPR